MTDTADFEDVRPRDHAVLVCIRNGDSDVRSIREATTLENWEVNDAFRNLSDKGMISVMKRDGFTTSVIDGQKRCYRKPKQAALTEKGAEYFEWNGHDDDCGRYSPMDRDELVRTVRDLEEEMAALRQAFDSFRRQVAEELRKRQRIQ